MAKTTVISCYQSRPAYKSLTKVPKLTAAFWIAKVLTTADGEAASDWLVHRLNPYVAVIIGFGFLAAAMTIQFRMKKYAAWSYWLAALAVSVAGTMCADVLHVGFGVPYVVSFLIYAVLLASVFFVWRRCEGNLSVHSVRSGRREFFYWAAVITTFAMGTAVGDLTAYALRLGFLVSGIVFLVLFALPGLALLLRWIGPILAFWASYILTRPLGASFADYTGKPPSAGGLGWGDGHVALVLFALIVLTVAYLAISRSDLPIPDRETVE